MLSSLGLALVKVLSWFNTYIHIGYHWNRVDEHIFMACLFYTITQPRKLHIFERDISSDLLNTVSPLFHYR